MNILKKIAKNQTLELQLHNLPKLYQSHVWITPPAQDGLSFLGISEFAKHYFARISKINLTAHPKSLYGISSRQTIKAFIEQTQQRREKGELLTSESIEWQRFQIKQNESFAMLQTLQFDVELLAPVDMRIVEIDHNVDYSIQLLTRPYWLRVEALNPIQLTLLNSEEKYLKSKKIIMF